MPVCLDFRGGDETKGINHGTRTYFAMPSMMAIRLFDMDSVVCTLPIVWPQQNSTILIFGSDPT